MQTLGVTLIMAFSLFPKVDAGLELTLRHHARQDGKGRRTHVLLPLLRAPVLPGMD